MLVAVWLLFPETIFRLRGRKLDHATVLERVRTAGGGIIGFRVTVILFFLCHLITEVRVQLTAVSRSV